MNDPPARLVHLSGLQRALARIFAVIALLTVLEFWVSPATHSGQTPGSIMTSSLLSAFLAWQALAAFRHALTQRDLSLLAAGTGILLLATRFLAVQGSPFAEQTAYILVAPVVAVWAALSRRLIVQVPLLLTIIATGVWQLRGDLPVEQAATTLATVALSGFGARLMQAGAQRADVTADTLSRQLASQDAALAAEEAERRAANMVHDDVLSVLSSLSNAAPPVPWNILVSKARQAQAALAGHSLAGGGHGFDDLGSALRRRALQAPPGLDVRCVLSGDLAVPPAVTDAIADAVGEALRNIALHAQVADATLCAQDMVNGGVRVVIRDCGVGFDPDRLDPASMGVRGSIRTRLADVAGNAKITSAPGKGTTVMLSWYPPSPDGMDAVDLLAWARRLAPRPTLIFAGFMLPPLLSSLLLLYLRWHDMRWQVASVGVFLSLLVLSAGCARNVTLVRMTWQAAAGLAAAVTLLTTVGSLAVAPGTTDAFAYWVSGESAVIISVLYFLRGTAFGLVALAFDLTALLTGLLTSGGDIPRGAWLGILASPILAAGLAAGVLAAFRGLASYTELQLASYQEGLRRQARAEATRRVDRQALENARRVAGPVLALAAVGQPHGETLRSAAELASAALRDELLAPGLLSPELTAAVRSARMTGIRITVNIPRKGGTLFMEPARRMLAAVLADMDAVIAVTLHGYAPVGEHAAQLILRLRRRGHREHDLLRACAHDYGALMSELDGGELLVQMQPRLADRFTP